ncbi:MAG: hypothetical protein P9M15_05525 [Candidatus Electryoneaceae bacterium]|nr:hypothetical protein [Candidatus Electryoneaceae bacterium]
MSENPICYWELASHNAEKSVEFFQKVFGWDFQKDADSPIHELPVVSVGDFKGGGIFTLQKAKLPFLTVYIKVDSIIEKIKLIEQEGGFIVIDLFELPCGTKICLFNEPSGVTFGMIESAKE